MNTNRSKKLLFIVPPYFNADDYLDNNRAAVLPAFTIPYGILSMEAYLKKELTDTAEISFIDLNITLHKLIDSAVAKNYLDVFVEEINSKLEEFKPDYVGISALFNSSSKYIENLVACVKKFDKKIITLAGGGLPSAAYFKLLQECPSLDAICKGEGELPLKAFFESNDAWQLLETHRSWITRDGIAAGKIPEHTFIENLDEIPFLNYGIADLAFYNNRGIDKRYTNIPKREMAIHTSRGCPFLCVFCSNPSLHGRDVRTMSVNRVISDVKRMRDEHGMTVLMLEDDHFFNDKDRAKAILREVAKLKIRVEFPNGLAVYAIDDEMARILAEAGVSAVALAVESGSDYVLNHIIKKPLKKRLIKPAVEALRKHGVRGHVFIVTGLPGETDEHREETRQMLLENGFDWVHVYLAMPIFGSRLYDICVENSYIENSNGLDHVATKSVIRTPTVDPKQLEEFAYKLQLEVNFVSSYNMRNGRHDIPITYMENVISKYPDHAFGHYFLAKCYEKTGKTLLSKKHLDSAKKIFERDTWWASLAKEFNIFEESQPRSLVCP